MALIVLLYSIYLGRDHLVMIELSLVGGYSYTVLVGLCLVCLLLVFYGFRVVTFLTRLWYVSALGSVSGVWLEGTLP